MIDKEIYRLINLLESIDEIKTINRAINDKWGRLQARATEKFYSGQVVTFKNRKGDIVKGTVKKVNVKSVTVEVQTDNVLPPMLWNVAPSLLTPIQE